MEFTVVIWFDRVKDTAELTRAIEEATGGVVTESDWEEV